MNCNSSKLRISGNFWPVLLILSVFTITVYAKSLSNGFVLDDEIIIVKNPQTLSLGNLPQILFSPDVIKPYYRPLNRISYLIDYQLAGMNPVWYHAINVLIHLGNALLLYLVSCRLLADRRAAMLAALLFAVHPANSEAVNFISARNTLMAAFFSLASLLTFLQARERGARWPLFSAFLLFCGLLSKETSLMLAGVMAYCSLVPLPSFTEERWQDRILFLSPYLLFITAYFAMRSYSLQGFIGADVPASGLFSRLAQNYHIIPQYLRLLLVPTDLTIFHRIPQGGLFTPLWFFPAWLALAVTAGMLVIKRNRVVLFCLAWCVMNYIPISNIVPIPSDQITERFLYMPAIGFFILLGVLTQYLFKMGMKTRLLWGMLSLFIIACSSLTFARTLQWKSNMTLYESGVANDPLSPKAHYNLGTALRENGDLESAGKEWEKALAIDPGYADALTQMGTLAAMKGDFVQAERFYNSALNAPQGAADADKSITHYNLGKIYEKWNQPHKAIQQYEQFLASVPAEYLEYKRDGELRLARLRGIPAAVPGK